MVGRLKMKSLILCILLLVSPAHAGLSLTDQLIMESRIQNQLQQQQRMNEFEQSLRIQTLESEMDKLRKQQQSGTDSVEILLWIMQNRPDLLRNK